MKKIFLVILLNFSCFCNADEYFRFANITCLEYAGFLEVYGTGILNIDASSKESKIVKDIERQSNLVYGRGVVEKKCKLKGGLFEVKLEYTEPAARGRCMGDPGASLTLKKNGKVLIENVDFDWACDWPDINRLTINSGQFINICGTNYSNASFKKNAFCISDFDFPADGTVVTNSFLSEKAEAQFKELNTIK